jgi:hypothetical protein
MPPSDSSALGYCHTVLLPVWERWTDGNPAMRWALDCASADPASHEEQRNRLFAAAQRFHGRSVSPANRAAKLAAEATLFALMGYPEALVQQLGARAETAQEQALTVVAPLPQRCVPPG